MTDAADRTAPLYCEDDHCQLRELRAQLQQAEGTLATVTHERDTAWGELGFTKTDLGNALYRAQQAEGERERLISEVEIQALRANAAQGTIRQLQEQQAALVALVAQLQEKVKELEARVGDTQYDSPLATAGENEQVPIVDRAVFAQAHGYRRDDPTCEHGVAWDVHCCGCHSGFIFDSRKCVCF